MAKRLPHKEAARYRRYRAEAFSRGRCKKCRSREHLPGKTQCRTCILQRAARVHLGDKGRAGELEALLLAQCNRCGYTFREIDIGRGASVEHISPLSRTPDRAFDIGNLRWVHWEINRMKGTLTVEEFIQSCKEVLEGFGYDIIEREK